MATELKNVSKFVAEYKKDKELWLKINSMVQYIVEQTNTEMNIVKNKYKDPTKLTNDAIKQIIIEQGYSYIQQVMNTLSGFDFNTMVYFVDLIGNLKGTRKGLDLVLKLMGFDSIIKEWWQAEPLPKEPWTYEIIVIMDTSIVPDVYNTIDKLKEFSDNYVLAAISNIDVRFSASRFAEAGAIMGGFSKVVHRGIVIQKARTV